MIVLIFSPDIKKLAGRVSAIFLYPLFISIFIPFLSDGNEIIKIDLKAFDLTITDNGLTVFITVLIKSFLSILLMSALLLSSSEMELLSGLRKIYFPRMIVSIIFLMYRYIFLMMEESRMGQMAIKARVFKRHSYGVINKRLTHLMSNLFIKSLNRVENIYKSMESRGFNGNFYMTENGMTGVKVSAGIAISFFLLVPVSIKIIELCDVF